MKNVLVKHDETHQNRMMNINENHAQKHFIEMELWEPCALQPEIVMNSTQSCQEDNWQKNEFYLELLKKTGERKIGIESALCDLKNFYM